VAPNRKPGTLIYWKWRQKKKRKVQRPQRKGGKKWGMKGTKPRHMALLKKFLNLENWKDITYVKTTGKKKKKTSKA